LLACKGKGGVCAEVAMRKGWKEAAAGIGRKRDGEMERWRDGRRRDGEMEGWRDGEMERWRDGETGRMETIKILPLVSWLEDHSFESIIITI
jgi:hypothetical protein